MIINNHILHTHDLIESLKNYTPLSEKTYRIKFNGAFICIKGKGEWAKLANAKNSFRAFIRRNSYHFNQLVNPNHTNYQNYYYLSKQDWADIFNQLVNDNVVEFVEITNQ